MTERPPAQTIAAALAAMRDAAPDNLDTAFRLTVMGAVLIAADSRIVVDELRIAHPDTGERLDRLVPGAIAALDATVDGAPVSRRLEILPR